VLQCISRNNIYLFLNKSKCRWCFW